MDISSCIHGLHEYIKILHIPCFLFFVDASNLFLVFSQNSRPVTFKQPVKLNKTRKVSDISNQAINQPTTVCPSD